MNSSASESSDSEKPSNKPLKVSVIVLIVAVICPVIVQVIGNGVNYFILISSFLYNFGATESSISFQLIPLEFLSTALILMFPRFAAPIQMHRYYSEQSDRRISLMVVFFSESTGFLMVLPAIFTNFSGGPIMIPTPLIFIVCALLLWLSPIPQPSKPWDESSKQEDWLEKEHEA
ncbi:MAG: hypothetical protein E4H14_19480 [Candidatus Thorarchaeota archaeon]|nr:MAG: hypothetical protein E4H14_19480 [Candidatus Thorarchaeota archaeon]